MRVLPNIEANRAWASEPSAAISKQSNIQAAGESGKDVLGVYTSMAPSGINFFPSCCRINDWANSNIKSVKSGGKGIGQ
jgi:hypothetical protein